MSEIKEFKSAGIRKPLFIDVTTQTHPVIAEAGAEELNQLLLEVDGGVTLTHTHTHKLCWKPEPRLTWTGGNWFKKNQEMTKTDQKRFVGGAQSSGLSAGAQQRSEHLQGQGRKPRDCRYGRGRGLAAREETRLVPHTWLPPSRKYTCSHTTVPHTQKKPHRLWAGPRSKGFWSAPQCLR